MFTKSCSGRYLGLCLTLAFLAGSTQLVLPTARAQEPTGQLTATGTVKVNGQSAATGDVVSSGSTIETAKGSSAVVSLGKLGRVEVRSETRMKLRYGKAGISVVVDSGSARVCDGAGQCRDYHPQSD